nr:serine hydrolase [Parahaliea mediterranea]
MSLSQVPGVAVAVVKTGEAPLVRGYGSRIVDGESDVDGDTVFAIGSMTKHITATALGILVEEGKLDWEAPLTGYLPELSFSDPYLSANLNLVDALSHRSGLARADLIWFARPGASRSEMLSVIERIPVEQAFRASYLYNNFLYLAAGQTIPRVTDGSWDDFLAQRLFEPLAMARSGTSNASLGSLDNVAMPHYFTPDGAVTTDYFDLAHVGPAGAVYSSAADMVKWCRAQLEPEQWESRIPGLTAALRATRQPRNFMALEDEGHAGNRHKAYALGLERMNYGPSQVMYTHGGAIQGMASNIAFVPEAGLCVAVLTNGETGSGVRYALTDWIMDRLLGLPAADDSALRAKLEQQRGRYLGAGQLHAAARDPSVAPPFALEAMAGEYDNPVYGRLSITLENGVLRTRYGSAFHGELQAYRGATFDVVPDDRARRQTMPAPFSLSANVEKSGVVESVLLQMPGPQKDGIRFQRVPENAER